LNAKTCLAVGIPRKLFGVVAVFALELLLHQLLLPSQLSLFLGCKLGFVFVFSFLICVEVVTRSTVVKGKVFVVSFTLDAFAI
jgi:hypothetical protein